LTDVSPQLKDLYITDFEMARLKEMKEAKLLRLYLKLEQYLPKELMFIVGQGIKIIVQTVFHQTDSSLLLPHGDLGFDMPKPALSIRPSRSGEIHSCS
jgi:hypothetical protein